MPTLTIMTINVRGAIFNDGANIWPARADLCARTIVRHSPDLIGFQELMLENLELFRSRMPTFGCELGPRYNDDPPHAHPSLMWRATRLHLTAAGGFWLSGTPERHSADWNTACIRTATWARLVCAESGSELLALNTHLDHVSELARVEGARLIVRRLAELGAARIPTIVTGDFNCDPGSAAYQAFIEAGFTDTFSVAADQDDCMTFHGFHGAEWRTRRHDANERIDWILARGMRPQSCAIIRDAAPPLYPSDHYPVVATVAY